MHSNEVEVKVWNDFRIECIGDRMTNQIRFAHASARERNEILDIFERRKSEEWLH
jgi:hypothetical protein